MANIIAATKLEQKIQNSTSVFFPVNSKFFVSYEKYYHFQSYYCQTNYSSISSMSQGPLKTLN